MITALATTHGMRMGTPDGQQSRGLYLARRGIESRAACRLEFVEARAPEEIRLAVRRRKPDVLLMLPDWKWPEEEAIGLCRDIQSAGVRVIFIDYYAPANSPHFGVLPFVDVYIKRQLLRDRSGYGVAMAGGTPFTDYLHKNLGIECAEWGFRSRLDPKYLDKVVVGWNLGAVGRYRRLCRVTRPVAFAWRTRPYEVNARLGLSPQCATGEWYERYRAYCADVVSGMERPPRTPGFTRVNRRRYYAELMLSKAVLSPFGWGEVCFRDYEAVACGSLLLKPSMSHLETAPDIYQDGKTYVALRWDLSDLKEKLDWIRNSPQECVTIVRNAQRSLLRYFQEDCVAQLVASAIQRARSGQ